MLPSKIRCLGILTAGGDSPGLNAAVRAITRTAIREYGIRVLGIQDGFRGLVENRMLVLDDAAVAGVLTRGGTILGTSRDKPHSMPIGGQLLDMTGAAVENARRHQIDCLVCLGGGGTAKNAYRLWQKGGLEVLTLPKTIDNDVAGTDTSFGFDTAVSVATEAIDRLHTTATSHHRLIVCEVMGHRAGWLALYAGVAGGADVILIPEIPYDLGKVAEFLLDRRRHGKRFSIIAVAEGARTLQEAEAAAGARAQEKDKERVRERGKGKPGGGARRRARDGHRGGGGGRHPGRPAGAHPPPARRDHGLPRGPGAHGLAAGAPPAGAHRRGGAGDQPRARAAGRGPDRLRPRPQHPDGRQGRRAPGRGHHQRDGGLPQRPVRAGAPGRGGRPAPAGPRRPRAGAGGAPGGHLLRGLSRSSPTARVRDRLEGMPAELAITSRANPRFKALRALLAPGGPRRGHTLLLGEKLIDAWREAPPGGRDRLRPMTWLRLEGADPHPLERTLAPETLVLGEALLRDLADAGSPPQHALLAAVGPDPAGPLAARVIVPWAIQDPGNLGAILRSAAAFGFQEALLGPQCADPFSPKALRGSMGAAFLLPVRRSGALVLDAGRWLALDGGPGALPLAEADLGDPLRILVGNEGHGWQGAELPLGVRRVAIPIHGVESLNAAVAAGIACFETARRAAR